MPSDFAKEDTTQAINTILLILGWEASTLLSGLTLSELGLYEKPVSSEPHMIQPWINLFIWSLWWFLSTSRLMFTQLMTKNGLLFRYFKYEPFIMVVPIVAMYLWAVCTWLSLSSFTWHQFASEYKTLANYMELWLLFTTLIVGAFVLKFSYMTCCCGCTLFTWVFQTLWYKDRPMTNPTQPDFHALL